MTKLSIDQIKMIPVLLSEGKKINDIARAYRVPASLIFELSKDLKK